MRKGYTVKIFFKIIVVLMVVSIIVILLYQFIMKKVYNTKYNEYVYLYAEENGVDPMLIFAIIKTESNFDPNAKSSVDAKGLMQLMESTAIEVAKELEIENFETEMLYNPEINIKIGIKYFSNLLNMYGNINTAIVAYNAGPGSVKKWIEQEIIKEDGSDIENVPFKETNLYIRKVLRDYKIYKSLYNSV